MFEIVALFLAAALMTFGAWHSLSCGTPSFEFGFLSALLAGALWLGLLEVIVSRHERENLP